MGRSLKCLLNCTPAAAIYGPALWAKPGDGGGKGAGSLAGKGEGGGGGRTKTGNEKKGGGE